MLYVVDRVILFCGLNVCIIVAQQLLFYFIFDILLFEGIVWVVVVSRSFSQLTKQNMVLLCAFGMLGDSVMLFVGVFFFGLFVDIFDFRQCGEYTIDVCLLVCVWGGRVIMLFNDFVVVFVVALLIHTRARKRDQIRIKRVNGKGGWWVV